MRRASKKELNRAKKTTAQITKAAWTRAFSKGKIIQQTAMAIAIVAVETIIRMHQLITLPAYLRFQKFQIISSRHKT